MKNPRLLNSLAAMCLLLSCTAGWAPQPGETALPRSPDTAEATVRLLYDLVTFGAGEEPDWSRVRELFLEQAVIVLRTSRDGQTVFDLEGFIQDFVRFIEQSNAKTTGFLEKVVRTRSMVFGDIAHVLVLYEAGIPGSERPPQPGVDSFQLIRQEDRWAVVSVTNELPISGRPVPEELRD